MARVHVSYELEVMCALSAARRPAGQAQEILDTMYLESMLVHVRNLDEFLRTPRHKVTKEQVCADHYFDDPWTPIKVIDGAMLGRLSSSLVHISLKRVRADSWESRDGSRAPYADDILDGFDQFVGALRDAGHADRAGWFDAVVADARAVRDASEAGEFVFARIDPRPQGPSVSSTSSSISSSPIVVTSLPTVAGTLSTVVPPVTR